MTGNQVLGMIIGLTGLVIVGIFGCWPVAFGVFLMLWGNNVENSNRVRKGLWGL